MEDIQVRWWSEIRDPLQILCRLDREELPTGLDPGSLLLFMIASLKWEVFGLVGRRGDIPPLGTPGEIPAKPESGVFRGFYPCSG